MSAGQGKVSPQMTSARVPQQAAVCLKVEDDVFLKRFLPLVVHPSGVGGGSALICLLQIPSHQRGMMRYAKKQNKNAHDRTGLVYFFFVRSPCKLASRETARFLFFFWSSERWAYPSVDPQEVEGECLAGEGSVGKGGGVESCLGEEGNRADREAEILGGGCRGSDGCFIKALLSLLEIPTVY